MKNSFKIIIISPVTRSLSGLTERARRLLLYRSQIYRVPPQSGQTMKTLTKCPLGGRGLCAQYRVLMLNYVICILPGVEKTARCS